MKILIAYDGSKSSEAALDDLVRAGLPDECEVVVLTVAEAWLPHFGDHAKDVYGLEKNTKARTDKKFIGEAETLAKHAMKRLCSMFPQWQVSSVATYGSPACSILKQAERIKADLIVMGSHGRTAINRFVLGSISQKVVAEATCSVRVARGRIEVDPTPVRIVIGFDGSKGAFAAVDAVASRSWRDHSEIALVAATDGVRPVDIGRFIPPIEHIVDDMNASEREWIERLAKNALVRLRNDTITADLHLYSGSPKNIVVEQAEKWNADCICVGANEFGGRFERFLLGSTSAAVAARAHCSVEIVRK